MWGMPNMLAIYTDATHTQQTYISLFFFVLLSYCLNLSISINKNSHLAFSAIKTTNKTKLFCLIGGCMGCKHPTHGFYACWRIAASKSSIAWRYAAKSTFLTTAPSLAI